jgi:hypothetical protein
MVLLGSNGAIQHRGTRRKGGRSLFETLMATLTFLVVALLLLAFHLTTQLAHQPQRILQSPNTPKPKLQSPYNKWPKLSYDPSKTPGVLRSNGAYAQNRVYCMIPFVWRQDFYDAITNSWGKRCDQIYFFTDAIVNLDADFKSDIIKEKDGNDGYKPYWEYPEGTFPDNVIFVNMTRPWDGCKDEKTGKPKICRHIWEKMWRSWVYVADNHLDRAEWFCKIDYDTFFFPENLQYFVQDYKQWNAKDEHHYFGHVLYHRGSTGFVAGPCACWSHKTLMGIADVYREMPKGFMGPERGQCEDRNGATEEISTNLCLKEGLGVVAEETIDDKHRDFVLVDPYHNHLEWNRTKQGEWWFWKGKEPERGQMEECCSDRPIATHKYKHHSQPGHLENQFYGSNGKENKDLWNLTPLDRRYVDKVRKAMGTDP